MARAVVRLPRLLEPAVGTVRQVEVTGSTIGEAITDLLRQQPTLQVHLFDEQNHLRPHVLCFHNGTPDRDVTHGTAPLSDGDEIVFLQAVSGG
ncbi:MAG TPA: MoaD/ThiS family protein [Acidimicrobiia bacterium]|nr:MoaD/ThiS family protein [Acidimicrobiia bacterium]